MPSALLQLLRPANVVTALADVLAGAALATPTDLRGLPWLLGATGCLYAGGVVLNDFFDRHLDAIERPERPLPSGRIRPGQAALLGAVLLAVGLGAASMVNSAAGVVAAGIAATVLLYDFAGKHHPFFGPLNMGLCRGLNLLLGIAIVPSALAVSWPFACLSIVYIAGVTVLSRGEVSGERRPVALAALVLVSLVLLALLALVARPNGFSLLGFALLLLLGWRVLPPFWEASRQPNPATIRNAVRRGVLSLVLLDAVLAAQAGGLGYCVAVLATGLAAASLARFFAVT